MLALNYDNYRRLPEMRMVKAGKIVQSSLRGKWLRDEPMSRHVSWRAGGHAANFYVPADIDDLAAFLAVWPENEPVYMVGLGSNLLVRDGGVTGVVIMLHARLNDLVLIERDTQGGLIYAGAGVACAKLARFAAAQNLAGAEFLAGIPGTVGGALAMNAGCYGSQTWEQVERVNTIDRTGALRERQPDEYEIGYRQVVLRGNAPVSDTETWFTGGWFRLNAGNQETSRQGIKSLLATRIKSQPLNYPNAGSVFRNPPGDHAARLIEECGLKGWRIGDAMVSPKHVNFIVNCGQASASDIEAVIESVKETVLVRMGVVLIPEVHIIGEERKA
ncbi:UDP-N-acetylenolpyruvoylglucosamine reductase [Nitrosomonas mobilis]|uniref:UDP-N-acetylenolpyruvoylglucosamine reductase n=2 Tax=Nitrosomonas mobilis TaxID=51642 RepID=A0A1G5SID5_9PROT|nr:UDP-N-acetylenolpyruvoylglucosamine reductase [Nitrosomonas mobilis]